MNKFTKRDLGFAVLTGGITGVIGWQVLQFLAVPEFQSIPWVALVIIVPILWIIGVEFGYFLGQWMDFFNQFGKFAAIGFTNYAVTVGVLNVFIYFTGYTSGFGYSAISGASFIVGLLSSYVWNKYWAFKSNKNKASGLEFFKFLIVTVIAFIINVTVASLVVNYIHPLGGLDAKTWANAGTIIGSATGLIFSFIGFKLAVFKN
jgi:putative flippase GtrA